MSGDLGAIGLTVLLLAANAFFVGAEFALITARRDRLETLLAQGKTRAKSVLSAGQNLSAMLAGAQLGITICSILLGQVGEPAIAHLIETPLHAAGLPDSALHPVAFAIAMSLVVVLHILLGEMVPKNIAIAGPERVAMLLVPAHVTFVRLTTPLVWVYNLTANLILRAFGVTPKDELDASYDSAELSAMIGDSRTEGLIDGQEHRRLLQALGAAGRTVADVAIAGADVRTVPLAGEGPTLGSLEAAITETGFSRYPVIHPATGSYVGYIHVKDVLADVLDDARGPEWIISAAAVRTLPSIQSTSSLNGALALLRASNSHLGQVVSDSGAVTGLVALEDLVEEFVGTVRDATHR